MLNPSPVVCSWTLFVQDSSYGPISLTFNFTNDNAPLTIGLEFQRYSIRDFACTRPSITLKRPLDSSPRTLPVHIRGGGPLDMRAYVDVIGLGPIQFFGALLAPSSFGPKIRPVTMAKFIRRFKHAPFLEMVNLLCRSGCQEGYTRKICKKVVLNCLVCQQSGLPAQSKKISLTHTCEAFNVEIQTDFMFADIRSSKHCIIHIVDTGTGYSETSIVVQRSAHVMASMIEILWIHIHGAPKFFSAHSEFTKSPMKKVLRGHSIQGDYKI